jgi:heme oxygenase
MSLKELTAEKHRAAEESPFMQAVFNVTMPISMWADYTYNKWAFYSMLENRAQEYPIFSDLIELGLQRADLLFMDAFYMGAPDAYIKPSTNQYIDYLSKLDERGILAHVYVWHMGDLYGGQIIKMLIPDASHESLEFENPEALRNALRAKLSDDLAEEANIAFDWAIRIMNEYIPV